MFQAFTCIKKVRFLGELQAFHFVAFPSHIPIACCNPTGNFNVILQRAQRMSFLSESWSQVLSCLFQPPEMFCASGFLQYYLTIKCLRHLVFSAFQALLACVVKLAYLHIYAPSG